MTKSQIITAHACVGNSTVLQVNHALVPCKSLRLYSYHSVLTLYVNQYCFYCQPLTMHLACVNLRMTMEESLVAATINAAASLGRSHTHGSLELGKVADMLVIDAPR